MQNINLRYPVSPFEQLFIDKATELLFKNSIDSYRLRLHNPKTLIEELISVCQSSISGFLTNNDYASATAKELVNALGEDHHGIEFKKVSKKHYMEILGKTSSSNYSLIIQSSKLILKDNSDYVNHVFDELMTEIASFGTHINDASPKYYNDIAACEKKIVVLSNHFFVGLIRKGYNKHYVSNFFQMTFVYTRAAGLDFTARMEILKTLILRTAEEFTVIFEVVGTTFQFNELKRIDPGYDRVTRQFRALMSSSASSKVNDFLEANNQNFMVYLKTMAFDYYKAIEISMDKISKDLDIYHLGYTQNLIKIGEKCAVVGNINPSKSSTFPSNFQIDGYVRSGADVFDALWNKIQKIKDNNIDDDSYDKIISAIRYYRTGSESAELETKLLNYWIGLEYIFTSKLPEQKTIERMRNYLPACHSLIYVKRNLWDFHKTIKRLGIDHLITGFSDDLLYLTKHSTYQQIIDQSPNELLKFRSKYFQKWVESPSNIDVAIKKHVTNLTWNITRLYRIRNEIVHNAAIKQGIYVHISHLKYYLTFVLNSILDFMAEAPVDLDNDGKVSIEDFFNTQNIMLGSLKDSTLKAYTAIENPSQILH
jgi:hypothetical protein